MVDSGPATSLPAPVAPLSRPGTYFGRVIVFLILCGIAVAFLQERIVTAFLANPVLNAVIITALLAGIVLALHALWQIGREVRWANAKLRSAVSSSRLRPYLLGPLEGAFTGAVKSLTPLNQRALLDFFEARLYEGREILRYLAGLLVFLGLLGTFWGLLETVRSIGGVIGTMHTSGSESGALFEDLKSGLAAPLAGMGISFSSSLSASRARSSSAFSISRSGAPIRVSRPKWRTVSRNVSRSPRKAASFRRSRASSTPLPS